MSQVHDLNIAQIERSFYLIDTNFSTLYEAANDDMRRTLIATRDAARDTFWAAVDRSLEDNHELVQSIRAQLDDANEQLAAMIAEMNWISETIDLITEIVKLASSLATIAAV